MCVYLAHFLALLPGPDGPVGAAGEHEALLREDGHGQDGRRALLSLPRGQLTP